MQLRGRCGTRRPNKIDLVAKDVGRTGYMGRNHPFRLFRRWRQRRPGGGRGEIAARVGDGSHPLRRAGALPRVSRHRQHRAAGLGPGLRCVPGYGAVPASAAARAHAGGVGPQFEARNLKHEARNKFEAQRRNDGKQRAAASRELRCQGERDRNQTGKGAEQKVKEMKRRFDNWNFDFGFWICFVPRISCLSRGFCHWNFGF